MIQLKNLFWRPTLHRVSSAIVFVRENEPDHIKCLTFATCLLLSFIVNPCCSQDVDPSGPWPDITTTSKPWTRWWWHGSAVTKEGITRELEGLKEIGIGGVEVTPIYGVFGYEDRFVNFLSPEWMELLEHTLNEATRLQMGVDMATGTGWPFGGPWVTDDDACKNVRHKVYRLSGGSALKERIEFTEESLVRLVGSNIDTLHQRDIETSRAYALPDVRRISVPDLQQAVAARKDLQFLAIDQVRFEKKLPLKALIAWGKDEMIDLTAMVDPSGKLDWVAPPGDWKIYAVFEGAHGKMVERAGPGGEGNVIDHFSKDALKNYLSRFDSAFDRREVGSLRAFFNDSYEVDDAVGSSDWTPELFAEFEKRRGYDLRRHLPALFGHETPEKNERVLSDYRETISEMLLDNFTKPWRDWAHDKSALVRNQAHGAPSNILDLYGAVDIPEIEGTEPLRIRMASSAAHVSGKQLVSAETATWLGEHFQSSLSDVKTAADRFMVHGVNHLVYHGTAYSPQEDPWPGFLFYAAVHLNSRNPIWNDFDALNTYVARCQSFLQNSQPDNEILLYYPIYDAFALRGEEMVQHFDGIGKQFEGSSFARCAALLDAKGYGFDYISDKQIQELQTRTRNIVTRAGVQYKAIVIPHCRYIPLATLEKISALAKEGSPVIFYEGLPEDVAGFKDFVKNKLRFGVILKSIEAAKTAKKISVASGERIDPILANVGIRRESFVGQGLSYIRKRTGDHALYFINNPGATPFRGWISVAMRAGKINFFNPMTGAAGFTTARRTAAHESKVYIELQPKESLIITTGRGRADNPSPFYAKAGNSIRLKGTWSVQFLQGGPSLPPSLQIDSLVSWTSFGEEYISFSGSAAYEISFAKPAGPWGFWKMDLGSVKESATVYLNGVVVGKLLGPEYSLVIPATQLKDRNQLRVVVSNLMANRIAYMDRKKIFWKKFYNVNFPARLPENRRNGLFDASLWPVFDSGLVGPVTLTPLKLR